MQDTHCNEKERGNTVIYAIPEKEKNPHLEKGKEVIQKRSSERGANPSAA